MLNIPDLYGPFVRRILAPLWAAKDRSPYLRILRDLERTQFLPAAEIRHRQLEKLHKLVAHAYEHVPFYRRRLASIGYSPGDSFDFADFAKLPLLTKQDIQNHGEDLWSRKYVKDELVANMTGGSTGSPLQFYHDRLRIESRKAATWRHNAWAGYRLGDKAAFLWGMPRDISMVRHFRGKIRNRLLERLIVLDTSSITEQRFRDFHHRLWRHRPRVIVGYANSLYLFSQYLEAASLSPPPIVGLISSAEILFPEYREVIERVFKTRVFDRYGCREVSIIASECEEHDGLHINAENIYVEIESPGVNSNPNAIGEIILTDLENTGTPFLRYRVEDLGRLPDGDCPCGRGLPRIELAGGRTTEFLVTPSGTLVSGAALTILLVAKTPGVRQAQLIQDKLDELTVRVVKLPNADFEENGMRQKITDYLGADIQVQFEYPNEIPRTASGKYRFSISRVTPTFFGGARAKTE